MNDIQRQKVAFDAFRDSMDFFVSQHPLTLQELFEVAVKEAVKEWLDDLSGMHITVSFVRGNQHAASRSAESAPSQQTQH